MDKSGRAEGVYYLKRGAKLFAKARKEVIVSAGTVDSAKLLMLSGIGPKKHLKSVGVCFKLKLAELQMNWNCERRTQLTINFICKCFR